jgi:citrate lyase beta subunit
MKTTRVGGGHPGYRVIADPDPDDPEAPRPTAQQDPWHYSIARMVDACTSAGILPFYGPYGDIKDTEGCETQFRAAFLLGCVGAWSLHPAQIEIAKKVFSPDPEEVRFAKKVIEDPDPDDPETPRATAQQDPWHYSIARMVDACTSAGILPFYGPYGDIKDTLGCETQFRAAFLLGCVGAWSLHPAQIEIAKKVFSPPPDEVKFAKKVLEAIPDGRGVHMIDGKMQDDATWKQCKVMVTLAELLAKKDPELAEAYGLEGSVGDGG